MICLFGAGGRPERVLWTALPWCCLNDKEIDGRHGAIKVRSSILKFLQMNRNALLQLNDTRRECMNPAIQSTMLCLKYDVGHWFMIYCVKCFDIAIVTHNMPDKHCNLIHRTRWSFCAPSSLIEELKTQKFKTRAKNIPSTRWLLSYNPTVSNWLWEFGIYDGSVFCSWCAQCWGISLSHSRLPIPFKV